jgi:hypothetical protein
MIVASEIDGDGLAIACGCLGVLEWCEEREVTAHDFRKVLSELERRESLITAPPANQAAEK